MAEQAGKPRRLAIVEIVVSIILIGLAFAAIAAADVSPGSTDSAWFFLVGAYALAAFVFDRLHGGYSLTNWSSALPIAFHWIGVLGAVVLVHVYESAGRFDNVETGLGCGLALALGAFTAGVHGNWRMTFIGTALGLATAAVAVLEEYMWVLFVLAVAAIVLMILVERLRRRHRAHA
ncbi:hypothetical protein DLJ53_06980 [Acuticoccus sediminis]|uniref:Uncharacterized protein n=1 Tax=Acuticoccus sediminis TaxID=2184697 RepID=A0A8B2P160_9HYPH|nr:hypothetical protein [Acuticoccus sediminis]RAI04185.1 hypothetical protein DLJ53_06980 [Acuticoccus sediminis]